jgi:hypothetical protein
MSNKFGSSRVVTESEARLITRRQQPIPTVALQTTLTTLYTANETLDFMVRHMWAANIDGSARTITIHLVPIGLGATNANAICKGYSIAANTTVRLDFIAGNTFGSLLQPGMSIQALASSNDTVNLGGWGQDVVGEFI